MNEYTKALLRVHSLCYCRHRRYTLNSCSLSLFQSFSFCNFLDVLSGTYSFIGKMLLCIDTVLSGSFKSSQTNWFIYVPPRIKIAFTGEVSISKGRSQYLLNLEQLVVSRDAKEICGITRPGHLLRFQGLKNQALTLKRLKEFIPDQSGVMGKSMYKGKYEIKNRKGSGYVSPVLTRSGYSRKMALKK